MMLYGSKLVYVCHCFFYRIRPYEPETLYTAFLRRSLIVVGYRHFVCFFLVLLLVNFLLLIQCCRKTMGATCQFLCAS